MKLNGTIIPSDEHYEVLKKYDVLAIVDDYTANVPLCKKNRVQIVDKLCKHGIRIEDNFVPQWFDFAVDSTDNSKMTDKELSEYFDGCGNPWNCHENGKLYSCNFSRFAAKAGIIPETDYDSFDLTIASTIEHKRELVEFVLGTAGDMLNSVNVVRVGRL